MVQQSLSSFLRGDSYCQEKKEKEKKGLPAQLVSELISVLCANPKLVPVWESAKDHGATCLANTVTSAEDGPLGNQRAAHEAPVHATGTVNSSDQVARWKIQSQPLEREQEPRTSPECTGIPMETPLHQSRKADCLHKWFPSRTLFLGSGGEDAHFQKTRREA